MSSFTPISRNGHQYSFTEGSFEYKDPFGRETSISFSEKIKLRTNAWGSSLWIRASRANVPLTALEKTEQGSVVLELLRRYRRVNPDAAKKSAFDYIEAQKSFVAVAFAVSLFFCAPLAVVLLKDSREQFHCTESLKAQSMLGEMQVVKAKKKRKGHYILNLEFVTPSGFKIIGRDQIITDNETTIPKTVPVVYAPSEPSCWSLTPDLVGKEPNWAKRRFFGAFTMMFGGFFLFTAFFGLAWSILRWFQRRPFAEEIRKEFQL
jgi:hypothetical protein